MIKTFIINLIIITSIFSCRTSKITENPPFTILKATYINWYGGRKDVKGIKTDIKITKIKNNLRFNFLYFKNKKEAITTTKNKNETILTSNINTSNRQISLQMHQDPKKEYGNELPDPKKNTLFDLKENEAIISYTLNKKEYFYKLKLTKGKDLFYP